MKKNLFLIGLIFGLVQLNAQTRVPNDGSSPIYYKDGNVGVGTSSPRMKLAVYGDISTSNNGYNYKIGFSTTDAFNYYENKIAYYGISLIKGNVHNNTVALSGYAGLNLYTAGGLRMRILQDGKIGIGTSTPSAKLDVAGNIKAQEIEVTLASMQDLNLNGTLAANNITYTANGQTADHVFEEDYNLRSLEEIEAFILENKHLPDVPSAAAMEEEGVNLAEMNKLLLQKVEELTLYAIEQESRLMMKDEEMKEMRSEMENRLAKMEVLLEQLLNR